MNKRTFFSGNTKINMNKMINFPNKRSFYEMKNGVVSSKLPNTWFDVVVFLSLQNKMTVPFGVVWMCV